MSLQQLCEDVLGKCAKFESDSDKKACLLEQLTGSGHRGHRGHSGGEEAADAYGEMREQRQEYEESGEGVAGGDSAREELDDTAAAPAADGYKREFLSDEAKDGKPPALLCAGTMQGGVCIPR